MPREFIEVEMNRTPGTPWGIRIGGGQDRGRVLVLEKVTFSSLAHDHGLRTRDYIVEINGSEVFGLKHEECKALITSAKDHLKIKVERGDHIVPSLDEAFPKKKTEDATDGNKKEKPYWIRAIESGAGVRNSTGFTTVGKPRIATKQYNSPMDMYSEEALEEMMNEGTINGKPVDMSNLMNPTGKEFDSTQSNVLAFLEDDDRRV